jgi:hypothetical protein
MGYLAGFMLSIIISQESEMESRIAFIIASTAPATTPHQLPLAGSHGVRK